MPFRTKGISDGSAAIGSDVIGGTAGSVLFVNASGDLGQDNANLYWDDASNFLGIGTNSPTETLSVTGTATMTYDFGSGRTADFNLHDDLGESGVEGAMISYFFPPNKLNFAGTGDFTNFGMGNNLSALAYMNLTTNESQQIKATAGQIVLYSYDGTETDVGSTLAVTATGGVSLTGSTGSNTVFQAATSGSSNILLIKNDGSIDAQFPYLFKTFNVLELAGSSNTNAYVGTKADPQITTGSQNVALGAGAAALLDTGDSNTILGSGSMAILTSGDNNVAVGSNAGDSITTGDNNTFLGTEADADNGAHDNSIAIGNQAVVTGSNQMVIGSATSEISDLYIGSGVTEAAPGTINIRGTGASGTDTAAANMSIIPGLATGNANSGDLLIKTGDVGGSGTTLQTATTKVTFKANGNVGIGETSPASTLTVGGTFALKRIASSSDVQTSENTTIVGITDTTTTRTVTIDSDDIANPDQIFLVKDESGGAATNNITIATEGAETIDGAASISITVDYGVARLYTDGSNLFTF